MSSSARSGLSLSCTLAMPLEMFLSVALVTQRLLVLSAIAGQRCSLWGVEPRCLHSKSEYMINVSRRWMHRICALRYHICDIYVPIPHVRYVYSYIRSMRYV